MAVVLSENYEILLTF